MTKKKSLNSYLPITLLVAVSTMSSPTFAGVRSDLQTEEGRLSSRKIDLDKTRLKARCFLGLVENTSVEWSKCQEIFNSSASYAATPAKAGCSSYPEGSFQRQLCDLNQKIDALTKSMQADPQNTKDSQLQALLRERQNIQEMQTRAATELKESNASIQEIDKRLAEISKELIKSDAELEASAQLKDKNDAYRAAAKEIPDTIKGDERFKLLAPERAARQNAARDVYNAKKEDLSKKEDETKSEYAPCLVALRTYKDSLPTDIAKYCNAYAPSDADFSKAKTIGDIGSDERERIETYIVQKQDEKLAKLKSEKEQEYARLMSYADDTAECGHSKMAGNSWACQTANKTAEYGTLITAAAQQVAGVALQTNVNKNLQGLTAQSVTSDVFETAAKNADSTADTYNVMKNGAHVLAGTQTAMGLTSLVVGMTDPNLQQKAAEEHTTAGMKAVMAGVATEATAQAFRIQEEVARNTAENNRKIANGYRGIEDLKIGKNPDPLADQGTATPFAGLPTSDGTSTQGAAQKDGMTPEQYVNSGNLDTPPPSLGDPLNTSGNGGGGGNPVHGPAVSSGGAPASPGGGAGGGFFGGAGGGGGLSPSKEESEGGGAAHQYAGLMNNPAKYSTGGSGGSGSGGGGAAKGVDLSGMLAKFLPGFGGDKKEEHSGKGILAYGKRGIAGKGGAGEYDQDLTQVDRSKSLFDRVHTAYQSKLKERSIGL